MSANIFWYLVVGIPLYLWNDSYVDIVFYCKLSLAFTILFICYMFIVHRDPSKRLILKKDSFEFYDYELKTIVNWNDFQSYKISKWIPHLISLQINGQEDIIFGYYVFSSEQRKMLFRALDQKHG